MSRREELWERIRRTSRQEVILEEMIRLGFWPAEGEMPHDPADEIRRRGEITRELQRLRGEQKRLGNEAAMKREALKRRMAEARARRQETRERRERERQERAERWAERKAREVLYLGPKVSAGLGRWETDRERLESRGLPVISSAEELASAMNVTVGELRFLAFARPTSRTSHYVRFALPKRSGGVRVISAPMPRLKAAQLWVLRNVLDRVDLHEAAHGFRQGHSIATNASPHTGADVVVNMDLEDFFPTITYRRVKGLFRALGYSEAAATIFALLSTAPDLEEVEMDGRRYFVATSERRLPQGAPTSPAISNAICRRLDRRLEGLARACGFRYTRYADDLTFSASGAALAEIRSLLRDATAIVEHEGFRVNEAKTRVMRSSRRMEVTGLTVNERVAVPRATLRRFRATLFQIERDGPDGKHWGESTDVLASIVGFANFIFMVDPERGAPLRARALEVATRHGFTGFVRPIPPPKHPHESDAPDPKEPAPKRRRLWKLW